MQNQIDNNEIYNENEKERAFLISVDTGDFDALVSIKELEELADTAGAEVVGTSIQKRNAPVAATFVGKGKLPQRPIGIFTEALPKAGNMNLHAFVKI